MPKNVSLWPGGLSAVPAVERAILHRLENKFNFDTCVSLSAFWSSYWLDTPINENKISRRTLVIAGYDYCADFFLSQLYFGFFASKFVMLILTFTVTYFLSFLTIWPLLPFSKSLSGSSSFSWTFSISSSSPFYIDGFRSASLDFGATGSSSFVSRSKSSSSSKSSLI